MHISQRHLGTNVQIETTQLHLIQNKIHFHAKGLFPIHNRTYIKVKCVELAPSFRINRLCLFHLQLMGTVVALVVIFIQFMEGTINRDIPSFGYDEFK